MVRSLSKKKTQTKKEGYHETAKPWGSLRGRSRGIFTLIFSLYFMFYTLYLLTYLFCGQKMFIIIIRTAL